ncbi:10259_t:CDS:2, partial [Gigaspora margarita]
QRTTNLQKVYKANIFSTIGSETKGLQSLEHTSKIHPIKLQHKKDLVTEFYKPILEKWALKKKNELRKINNTANTTYSHKDSKFNNNADNDDIKTWYPCNNMIPADWPDLNNYKNLEKEVLVNYEKSTIINHADEIEDKKNMNYPKAKA